MNREYAFDVFLSHRAQDKPRVRAIAENLREAGLRVWFDEWVVRPGDDIYLAIERGLEQSRTLVLCLSRAAIDSAWVDLERSSALFRDPTNTERRFVPLLLEEAPLPDTLRRFKYVDYRNSDERAFRELLSACTNNPRLSTGARDAGPGVAPGEALAPPLASSIAKVATEGQVAPRIMFLGAVVLGSLGVAVAILVLMLRHAETLARLGLAGNLYYLVLLPLGLAVAVLLFGVLKSYAAYAGHEVGGDLELRGPIVGFLSVVILGFVFVPSPLPFAVTIFVHGERGPQETILRNRGTVFLDLGGNRQPGAIGEKGEAYFPGIPATFRGQLVRATIDADGYELANDTGWIRLSGDGVYLPIRAQGMRAFGYVKDEGGRPLPSARVSFAEYHTDTDESGFFQLDLSSDSLQSGAKLVVSARGFSSREATVVRGGGEFQILLRKSE
jgi:hypothetical protein